MVASSNIDPLVNNILNMSMSKDHVSIIKSLYKPKHDEDIAEELGIKATIVRTLLNDLHAKSLVEYERTKNKRTGWYTYLWKKRENKIDGYIYNYLHERLEELNNKLESEKDTTFLTCACGKAPLEKAMELNFICPECNDNFNEFDNSKTLNKLTSEIAKINRILKKKK